MTDHTEQQPNEPRKSVIGGSVNAAEYALIDAARQKAGVRNISEFVRETMLHRARHILSPKRREDQAA
jgi:uncharacterized protein (DUF1778 family)